MDKLTDHNKIRPLHILAKAAILFVLLNILWAFFSPKIGYASIYSHLVPGRPRLPFGEAPQLAYNFSLDSFEAMFESHEIEAHYTDDEYSVFIVGDSSVWGTLLTPEETLSGQLNKLNLEHKESGLPIRFYNFGYPTLSLAKDAMVIAEAASNYNPDLVLWMVTLESMPWELQQRSPIVENNPERLFQLDYWYGVPIEKTGVPIKYETFWDLTIVGQRKNIADIIRLQLYGFLWSATGIDQYYPADYSLAAWDLTDEMEYYGFTPETFDGSDLAFEVIQGGIDIANHYGEAETIIINEPILISGGENSDLRYNFYYPRWVYDQYRQLFRQYSLEMGWTYFDFWDSVPSQEFTNSAIHLTPVGEELLAKEIATKMQEMNEWSTTD